MKYQKSKTIQQKSNSFRSVGKNAMQLKDNRSLKITTVQKMSLEEEEQNELPVQQKPTTVNNTGLPDTLKSGIENLSGYAMDDVKVHYNSDKPAQLNAHAYAQGTDIHLGSGQEKHLPHEAWHVVQQKQGRVQPTTSVNGAQINDNVVLESEADVMGAKALQLKKNEDFKEQPNLLVRKGEGTQLKKYTNTNKGIIQAFDWKKSAKWGALGTLGIGALIAGAPLLFGASLAGGLAGSTVAGLSILGGAAIGGVAGREHLKTTTNGWYGIRPSNPYILYSIASAPPPTPRGLYIKGTATFGGEKYTTWKPNVSFFYGAQKTNPTVEEVEKIINTVETANKKDDDTSWAVVGKNDCAGFATTLQALIINDGEVGVHGSEIGKMWIHKFPENAKCEYHAATVVAEDGCQVTLEGHVSKDIKSPEFHIRNGINGFMADNQANSKIDLGKDSEERNAPPINIGELIDNREMMYDILKDDPNSVVGSSNLPVHKLN